MASGRWMAATMRIRPKQRGHSKTSSYAPDGSWLGPFEVVRRIVSVAASKRLEVLKSDPRGATCFCDVPPTLSPHMKLELPRCGSA
jgi:hypothetical protein